MAEPKMSESKLLDLTAQFAGPGQLEIQIKNVSGATLGIEPLLIEIKLPVEWVDERIGAAARKARTSVSPPNMASLGGVVGVAPAWSVWAFNDPNDHLAAIRVFNNLDQQTGGPANAPGRLDAGAVLTLRVPLRQQTGLTQITIPYSYQSGGRKAPRVDGSLEVTPPGVGTWTPRVSLTTDQPNPMMIPFTTKVKISWKIADAVSAVLRGPLSGGHSELRLSSERNSDFWIEEGAIEVRAVGPVTYLLDAEVKGPSGPPNVQVLRTVSLDISKAENYGSMRLLPDRALPHDQVEIQWAVWGVQHATILFGSHLSYKLELTEQDLSRNYHGVGIWPVRIPGDHEREVVSLKMKNDDETLPAINRDISVASWSKLPQNARFTGKPLALAYSEKNLGLLTNEGFWLAPVGGNDTELKDPNFRKVSTDTPKNWLALAALEKSFVVLRQVASDDLQLMRFGPDGKTQGLPLDLPGDLKPATRMAGTTFQLVAFANRVYVIVQSGGELRRALSAAFDPNGTRPEPLLEQLSKYELVSFNAGLYALNRSTGGMLRFDLKPSGELDGPLHAASATQAGKSMIRTGLPLSLGRVLIVLGPPAVTTFDDAQPTNLAGAPRIDLVPLRTPAEAEAAQQDLVYNPQKDKWTTCGHGLTLQPGALAAFRGGASERLWVIQPNGEMHTLQGAAEDLFAPDYVQKFPSKVLPSAMDGKREVKIHNRTAVDLVAVDSVCAAAGLDRMGATGPARVTPLLDAFPVHAEQTFTILYSKAEPQPVKLRLMASGSPKAGPRYVLELTFSGPDLSSLASVFKRLSTDDQGAFSIAEVPGTAEQYSANQVVLVPRAGLLTQVMSLYIFNSTFYEMKVHPVEIKNVFGERLVQFTRSTPGFQITFPEGEKIGTLYFDFDFAQPFGIEASLKSQPRQSLLRVNRDDEHMLDVKVAVVKKGEKFEYEMVDGSKGSFVPRPGPLSQFADVLACAFKEKNKREIDMVRLGDGAASMDGRWLYVPLGKPSNAGSIELWGFDSDSFAYRKATIQAGGGAFSLPNALAVSQDKLYAMFSDKTLYVMDYSLNVREQRSYSDYTYVSQLAVTPAGDVYLLAETQRMERFGPETTYFLLVQRATGQRAAFKLEGLNSPWDLGTLGVSPDGKKVAICREGGLTMVDPSSGKLEQIRFGVKEEGHIIFSRDGAWIYCAHVQRTFRAGTARRIVAGRQLTITRIRTGNVAEKRTLSLPDVADDFGLTGNTRKSFLVGESSREDSAYRMVLSPNDRSLFVSAGKTIYKIDTASFTLLPWTAVVELPCRVFHVKEGKKRTWTVFAIGSDYVGDGNKVDSYKTHLYAVSAPNP